MSEQRSYGTQSSDQYLPPAPPAPRNGLGTAALVLGIVGLLLVITVAGGVICGVLAIVFGFVGHSRAKRGVATNGGAAIAGAVMGIVAILASAIALYFYWPRGYDHHGCALAATSPCIQK